MKASTTVIFIAPLLSVVHATTHTVCYNYYMQKDGCVFSAAAQDQRCPAPPKDHPAPCKTFTHPGASKAKRSVADLERRYVTPKPSFAVGGGTGTCGFYNSTTEAGVCLWNGAEQNNPTIDTAGWLNGPPTVARECEVTFPSPILGPLLTDAGPHHSHVNSAISKERASPETRQYVKVLDGCYFGATSPNRGAPKLVLLSRWVLFNLFKPTEKENQDGLIYGGLSWQFDNTLNTSPQQAPV
ncbi:hypothetical protein PSHT_00590 [Puccinia striiformis]|uniref:Secreted protein n=1 Tax=Puccinia striiformis TaxID=27350 RepID=A0A2S4WMW9_9BASI|nr:hypothetical protein PSHT_00590 [Puccinia striiformis]